MIFASPWFLLFLAAIPVYLVLKYRGTKLGKMNMTPTMLYSSNSLLSRRTTAIGRLFDLIGDGIYMVGRDPAEIEANWQRVYHSYGELNPRGYITHLLSAVDIDRKSVV